MKKTTEFKVDLAHLSPLTAAQFAELAALAAMPDKDINYSDIPKLPESFWENAVHNPFYKPVKKPTTVRLDADVLAWLQSTGRGYQTRINAILREAMLRKIGPPASALTNTEAGHG